VADVRTTLDNYKNTDALVNRSVHNRYDYKALIQDINTRRIDLDIAERSLYYPTVSSFGDFNLSGTALDEVTNTRVASYGITISYPIFIGFDLKSTKEIAEIGRASCRERV